MHIKLLFFCFIFILASTIQSFCIYNYLSDNTSFKVRAFNGHFSTPKSFVKAISPGGTECCHYSNKDCTPRGVDYDPMSFELIFWWPRHVSGRFNLRCFAGGALAIYGTELNHWAECTGLDGQIYRLDF